MEPYNLLQLIEKRPGALLENKRDRLIIQLREAVDEAYSFERIYEERFANYKADELSGYRRLDLTKLFNAILFFCKGGALKTKLNKLLFYADFKHFKEYTVSITGARYAHITFGPAPDKYDYYFATLIEDGAIRVEEISYSDDAIGEKFVAVKNPDLSLFSECELKILLLVKEYFKEFKATEITKFSHKEKGYNETLNGNLISYEYAEELQL
jgi:hypothetical protein